MVAGGAGGVDGRVREEDECQRAMYADGVPKQARMVLGAGALLMPCFRNRGPLLGEKKSLHELNAFASIWALLENVLVVAASEGVFGVTKIISTPEETVHIRETLGIPDDYEVPCYLALGYPRVDTAWIEQLPVDIDERIHTNRWSG
jgi:nitroreductase